MLFITVTWYFFFLSAILCNHDFEANPDYYFENYISTVFIDKINVHNYANGKKNIKFVLFTSLAFKLWQWETVNSQLNQVKHLVTKFKWLCNCQELTSGWFSNILC